MSDLNSLPIACTLTPGDLQERLGSIRTLTREALLSYGRNGLELTLRYDSQPSSACERWSPVSGTAARS